MVGPLLLSPPTWLVATRLRMLPPRATGWRCPTRMYRCVALPSAADLSAHRALQEHGSDVSPSSTYAQPFAQSTYSVLASPPLPGRFPGISPRSSLTPPMLSRSTISFSSLAPQTKSKTPARYVSHWLRTSPRLTQSSRFRFPQATEGIDGSMQADRSFDRIQEETTRKF